MRREPLQPASYQSLVSGLDALRRRTVDAGLWRDVCEFAAGYGFPDSNPWGDNLPGTTHIHTLYGARMDGVDASDPDGLTRALMGGRRLARAYVDMIRRRFGDAADDLALVSVASMLGVRETWHACCLHRITRDELLRGERFDDAIANGTYPVDVHHPGGTRLLYLDGREETVTPGGRQILGRWRDEAGPTPACYHIPYRSLVPEGAENLLVAGRLVDADRDAYGALRVMVNCNQTGEAAGVACALALDDNVTLEKVAPQRLRQRLTEGGSILV